MLNRSDCVIIGVLIALLMVASIGTFKITLDRPADQMAQQSAE